MSSITNSTSTAKSSDELKDEVDAALARVGRDLTELKQDLQPQNLIENVILKDRFTKVRSSLDYVQSRPFLLAGIGLAAGFLIALQASKRYS